MHTPIAFLGPPFSACFYKGSKGPLCCSCAPILLPFYVRFRVLLINIIAHQAQYGTVGCTVGCWTWPKSCRGEDSVAGWIGGSCHAVGFAFALSNFHK